MLAKDGVFHSLTTKILRFDSKINILRFRVHHLFPAFEVPVVFLSPGNRSEGSENDRQLSRKITLSSTWCLRRIGNSYGFIMGIGFFYGFGIFHVNVMGYDYDMTRFFLVI